MRRQGSPAAVALFCCASVLAGCGGGSPTSPTPNPPSQPTFQNIAGTWTGTVGGVTQGVTLAGTITVTLQQNVGVLSGGYSMEGTLTNPVSQAQLVGQVTLTGTVASGPNPAVNFSVTSVPCPSLPSQAWSGSYSSSTGVITITGTAHIITVPTCTIILSYPQTILLTR